MLKRTDRLIVGCSIAFALITVGLISTSIIHSLQHNVGSSLADLNYTSLSETGNYAILASLITFVLTVLFTLRFLSMRFQEAKKSLQQRSQKLEALAISNQQINKNLEIPAVMRALIESALVLTEASGGAGGLIVDGQMVFTEYYNNGEWMPINFSFPPGYGVPGWVIENMRPYLTNDAKSDLQVIPEIRDQLGFYNLLDTPIINADGELLGCFEIHNTKDRRPFDEHDIIALKGLSASVAIAIENAKYLSAQKKAQDRLLKSEGKFRSLFENSPTSLWEEDFSAVKLYLDDIRRQGVSDLTSFFETNPEAALRCARMVRVVDVNQKTIEIFSARTKADLLSHLDLVFTEKSLEPFIQGVIAMADNLTDYKATGINKTLNGEELEFKVQASILPGYEDSWGKVIVSMTDVTHEREIDRLKNEFISTAAHELRTPLTVIMGYSDLILEHLETTEFSIEQKKEFLHNINTKVLALERIVEDLLDVSKIESGRPLILEKAPTKLSMLIEELIRNHQRETSNHRITSNVADLNLLLMIDSGRITQVLDNLLNNAIKYSPDGGNIEIDCHQDSEQIEIRVKDHGLGMTEEQADRIFDKFYRADTSDTALGGLGLGMSIAKNIVEAHGGSIWIDTIPGEGTTVRFTLPAQTQVESYFTQEIVGSDQIH